MTFILARSILGDHRIFAGERVSSYELNPGNVTERYTVLGIEPVTRTPHGFTNIIKSDLVRYPKVIKDAGIKVEVN